MAVCARLGVSGRVDRVTHARSTIGAAFSSATAADTEKAYATSRASAAGSAGGASHSRDAQRRGSRSPTWSKNMGL